MSLRISLVGLLLVCSCRSQPFRRQASDWPAEQLLIERRSLAERSAADLLDLIRVTDLQADAAGRELARRGDSHISILLDLVRHERYQEGAAIALSYISAPELNVVPPLIAVLAERVPQNYHAWRNAAAALAKLGPRAAAAVPVLVEHTARGGIDPVMSINGRQRSWAAQAALVSIGEAAVAPTTELLGRESPSVRADALRILGMIGTPALASDMEIGRSLDDPEQEVRRAAVKAILRIGRLTPRLRAAITRRIEIEHGGELSELLLEAQRLPSAASR